MPHRHRTAPVTPLQNKLSSEQWSEFWNSGSITTFMGRFQANYEGEILEFWKGVFDRLDKDANIVDLATGNGAIALLTAQYSLAFQKSFSVTGIDFASNSPRANLKRRGYRRELKLLKFLNNTSVTDTNLPSHQFSLATSQFGIEYAPPSECAKELDRILKKSGATLACMIHRDDSVIADQGREGLKQAGIFRNSTLTRVIIDLLWCLDRNGGRSSLESEEARRRINDIVSTLHDAIDSAEDPTHLAQYLSRTMSVFSPQYANHLELDEKVAFLEKVEEENRNYEARISDLLSSARSVDEIEAFAGFMESYDFRIEKSEPFAFEQQLFAHTLVLTR